MGEKQFAFLGKYKFNSVFFKTFAMIIALSLSLAMVFYFFSWRSAMDRIEEKTKTATLNMLERTANYTDFIISNINETLLNISKNEYVVNSAIMPGMEYSGRNYNLIKYLKTTVKNNELIDAITIYSSFDGSIYTDSGVAANEDYQERAFIQEYNSCPHGSCEIKRDGYITHINIIEGRIFMLLEFPIPRPNQLGIIVIEINKQKLYEMIQVKNSTNEERIYIYYNGSEPIFNEFLDYPELTQSLLAYNEGQSGYFTNPEDEIYFFNKSYITEWIYIYPVDVSMMTVTYWDTFVIMLPVLSIFLLVSIIFSILVTRNIYKPIRNLIDNVIDEPQKLPTSDNDALVKNEFEFLGIAYENAVEQRQKLKNVMEKVAPMVIEKLFAMIISDTEVDNSEIENTLLSVSSTFNIDGRYTALVFSIMKHGNEKLSDIEYNICLLSIKNIIKKTINEKYSYICLNTPDSTVTLFIEFDSSPSIIDVKRECLNLFNKMDKKIKVLPFNVIIGRAGIYNKIISIKYSYKEAVEDLNFKKYLGDHEDAKFSLSENIKDNDAVFSFNKPYFISRMKKMLQNNSGSNIEEIMKYVLYIIQAISQNNKDLASAAISYTAMVDSITEMMVSFSINGEEDVFKDIYALETDLKSFKDVKSIENHIYNVCKRAVELMNSHKKKTQYKYIILAKEYIENNYMDSNLSQNTVSEHIGINASYLSRLFYEYSHTHFVDFLNEVRISKAKQLLKNTNFTQKEIGFKIGYNSIQNFIRAFKKIQGITPGQYRINIHLAK